MALHRIIVPVLDRAHRLPFEDAVGIIDRELEFAAGPHDRAKGAEAVCSRRLHRNRDTAPAAGVGPPAPALLIGEQFAGPHQHPKRTADTFRVEARMPRRYQPEPWMIGRLEESADIEGGLINGGDRLCLANDRCRIKGHEYLPLNAILSPPEAVPSLETTQPRGGRVSARLPAFVTLTRSALAVLRAIRRSAPARRCLGEALVSLLRACGQENFPRSAETREA